MAGASTICPALLYTDARAAVEQLRDAFGFAEEAVYEATDGTVLHAELSYGGDTVLVGSRAGRGVFARAMAGAGPSALYVVVADVDAHCARARRAGAEILAGPADREYGGRDYLARDLEGNIWSFGTYVPALGEVRGRD